VVGAETPTRFNNKNKEIAMPQYYAILDNGQSKPKGAGMPRRNQNKTYGTKKVNYRMREGSNYYGDVTAGKKNASYSKAEDARLAGKGRAKNNKAEDARLARGKKTSGRTADSRARGGARTSGRTADRRAGSPRTSGRGRM
jgi:hypothetical protein